MTDESQFSMDSVGDCSLTSLFYHNNGGVPAELFLQIGFLLKNGEEIQEPQPSHFHLWDLVSHGHGGFSQTLLGAAPEEMPWIYP